LRRQLESLEKARVLYEREIESLKGQIEAERRQLASVEKELKEVMSLTSRGLSPLPRQTGLERIQAQIMSAEQGFQTLILRAQQNITQVEQRSAEVQSERRLRLNTELQQTRFELDEIFTRIDTAHKLVSEAEVTAPLGAMRRTERSMIGHSFLIVRMQGGTAANLPAQETTALEPGDVIKVERDNGLSAVSDVTGARLPAGTLLNGRE
jgi:hypothetical protein